MNALSPHRPQGSPARAAQPSQALSWGLAAGGLGAAALLAAAIANGRRARQAERDNPPVGRFLDVDGVRLHLLDRGPRQPGSRPAAVLLHGNGATIEDMLSSGLVDRLAEGRRVIAVDRPGYGYSERPRGRAWTAKRQADLVAGALRQLGEAGAVVLGHSWGCSVAVQLALRHPDLVSGLVLEGGYFYPLPRIDVIGMSAPAIPVLGDVMRHTLSPPLSRLLWPRFVRKIFGPAPVPSKWEGFPREMALRPSQLRAAAEESALMIPGAWAAQGRYGEIRVPVAILAGAGDRMVTPDAQSARLHRAIPQSTYREVPGTGHMVHQTATDEVVAAVERVGA
jgi:pimeloyl-ACP methyl ester carboxylesterase